MKKISIKEVREALKNSDFRKSLPPELKNDVQKYEQNPNCPCNMQIYRNILKIAGEQLKAFYPSQEVMDEKDLPFVQENNFTVINCKTTELEQELKKLGVGRLQISAARYENDVTVIVNHLDNF